MIVAPRKSYYHPGEGLEGDRTPGPVLDDLGDVRRTITADGKMTQDGWRKAEKSDGPNEVPEEWTGRCVFRVKWSVTSMPAGVGVDQVDRPADPPGKLVFTNIPEYSLFADLSGEALPAPLVTIAKREEISEMYRRIVWLENY